ncbi:MAG: transposase domain-containing protein [bacterium]
MTAPEGPPLIYSLVGTAQLNQLEPFANFRDVITRISEHPHKQLAELLPQNWKRTVSPIANLRVFSNQFQDGVGRMVTFCLIHYRLT